MARDPEHAITFGQAVDAYDRGRPGYPAEALDLIVESASSRLRRRIVDVVDVGAGTGKLTSALAARFDRVRAVEPDDAMRARLLANVPGVTAFPGTAESIPLPDADTDLVTVAQAWHWVDPVRATTEVARVLRPGGTLALVWNIRDESVPWVRDLGELMGASPGVDENDSADPPLPGPLLRYDHVELPFSTSLTREQLTDLVFSRSYVIALDDERKAALRERLDDFLESTPELAGERIELPYVTRVTLAAE